jgi:hypothetical protein
MLAIWAYHLSLATKARESAMPHHSKRRSARASAPKQIDLFAESTPTIGGAPVWAGLPTETQLALTCLMTRLILDHADRRQRAATEGSHDL